MFADTAFNRACQAKKPCGQDAMCVNMPGDGHYVCLCPDGGTFDSARKQCNMTKTDPCTNYCMHNGACRWTENSGIKCR